MCCKEHVLGTFIYNEVRRIESVLNDIHKLLFMLWWPIHVHPIQLVGLMNMLQHDYSQQFHH